MNICTILESPKSICVQLFSKVFSTLDVIPRDFRTHLAAILLNLSLSSLHIFCDERKRDFKAAGCTNETNVNKYEHWFQILKNVALKVSE